MLTYNHQEATNKLNSYIERGMAGAEQVIQNVMNVRPVDELPKGGALNFFHNAEKAIAVSYDTPQQTQTRTVHRHAIGQMAQTIDMPVKFLDSLQDEKNDWGRELLAHNLNTIFHERFAKKRYLTRSVNNQVRGFLSDQYRRIDSRPVIEAFAQELKNKGALPYSGHVSDTKMQIQAIMPKVYEPIPGEVVAFGLSLENSDFGNGALSLRAYLLRIWCNNLAVTEETMRQIHLGKRLDESMIYSQRTYQLDADTTVSALRDVMRKQLDAPTLDAHMERMKQAAGTSVTIEEAQKQLRKLLNKGEAEDAIKAFESNDDYNLPAGQSAWRLSNAISWIANAKDVTPERKQELTKIAGDVVPGGKKAA